MNGERNLIRIAWERRQMPLLESEPDTNASLETVHPPPDFEFLEARDLRMADCLFCATDSWIDNVKATLNPYCAIDSCTLRGPELQEQVRKLTALLWGRLQRHINTRLGDKEKVGHWVWRFVRENMYRFSAILVLLGHVKDNLDGFIGGSHQRRCLLKSPTQGCFTELLQNSPSMKLRGSYVVFDPKNTAWIRSGKATRAFESRIKDHLKASSLRDDSSRFYRSFPSNKCDPQLLAALANQRVGFFEDLQFYCGACFSFDNVVSNSLVDTKDGGIFCWSKYVIACTKRMKWSSNTEEYKRLELIAYGFELVYDLCLAPDDNLSTNPGFETPLGVFGTN